MIILQKFLIPENKGSEQTDQYAEFQSDVRNYLLY